jgi:hypothetical protein
MSRRRLAHAATATALLVTLFCPAGHALGQEMARLFPEEADVFVPAPDLVRLPLPAAVLGACAPDLSDLRLFDRAGDEVPYLVDRGVPSGTRRRQARTAPGPVVDLVREEIPRDGRRSLTREIYRVSFPATAPAGTTWTLVVASVRPRFVRSVEVLGIDRDGSTVPLVPRASLVRLGQRLVDRTEIPLPPFAGAEITVTIEGEDGFFLEPTFRYASDRDLADGGSLVIPLGERDRRSAGGTTVLEAARPPGLVAGRLRVTTTTPVLDRRVTVWDVAASGAARRVGEGRLVRAASAGIGAGAEIEDLDVAIGPVSGVRVRLEIADGDSPPLADLGVSVEVSQPAIVFALPASPADRPAGTLRFGGHRAWPPRYDIAALFDNVPPASASGERLDDPAALPVARLGPVRPSPLFDARPALAAATHAGPAVDARRWRWQRPLVVPDSPEGLARLRLAPQDAAHAEPRYADLRVVDAAGRQWPYLIGSPHERERVALNVEGPERDRGESRWRIRLPATPLWLDRLSVLPTRPVLSRPYRVVSREADGDERVLARGTLEQDLKRPQAIEIALDPARVEWLELVVEDGDDAPLEIDRIEAALALPEILIAAPAGEYVLLAGNPDAVAPQYEIGRVSNVVLALRTAPVVAGPGAERPDWDGTPGGRARLLARLERAAVWAAIVVAVAVLAIVTLRTAGATRRGGRE